MSEAQYPFIDVAVHDRVSEAFAAGMAVVLFSADLRQVCWANGRGAALFGFSSVYDFLDQGLDRSGLSFRQIEPVARALRTVGDRRSITIRIVSGFSRVAVQAQCEMISVQGKSCILFSAPAASQDLTLAERAVRLIEGLDDPETHMAVIDGNGEVLASSSQFTTLDISEQTTRMLVSMVGNDRQRLVKRPIATASGYLPAAIGTVSADPALHLLFVVDLAQTPAPSPMDADQSASAALAAGEVLDHGEADYEEALDAVAAIEDNPDEQEEISLATDETPGDGNENRDEDLAAQNVGDTGSEEADRNDELPAGLMEDDQQQASAGEEPAVGDTDIGDIPNDAPEAAALPPEQDAIDELASPASVSADDGAPSEGIGTEPGHDISESGSKTHHPLASVRGTRTVRFVWKIDAGGRFSEVSREFAEAVGPHAADISGMAFSDLAALFNLDPDGKITELLGRRDTWSGKTIWWPVEGTSLVVPVDLAALPTYTRSREFDGFRGFGIVRMGDAQEDPHAAGLSLAPSVGGESVAEPSGAPTTVQDDAGQAPEEAFTLLPDLEHGEEEAAARDEIVPSPPVAETETENLAEDREDGGQTSGDGETAIAATGEEWPEGERPALKLVANPGQRHSDKVIRLEERRARLSPGEQAAFQEIARRLDTFAKKAGDAENDIPKHDNEPSVLPAVDDERLTASGQGEERSAEDAASSSVQEAAFEREMNDEPNLSAVEDVVELPSPAEEDEIAPDNTVGSDFGSQISDESPASDPADENLAQDGSNAAYSLPPARERNGLTAEIVDQMPVALLVHAGDHLIHANGEFLRLTGYGSLEALADVGGLDALLQRQELDDKTSEAGGMVVVRADDTIVPVTARLQSIRFNDAAALMLVLMPVAMSDHLPEPEPDEAERGEIIPLRPIRNADHMARLQVEVEELRAILETATDGVVIIGSEGDIRSMNRSASALFNFDGDEIEGKPFVTLFAHESQRAIIDYLAGLAGHGVASVLNDGREVIGREASGGFIPLFMTIGRLTSSNGYCAVIRDITQWKRTEEELRTAKRAAETANAHKSEFLAHVSHEIRTPLNAIIGFADMMASERLGPVGHSRYVEYANDIGRSGRHVLDIVNDLLDISKIEAGELDMDFIAVGLNETVSEAVSLVQPQANSQRVIIRTALSQAVPQVVADLRSIKQIVLNILSNAIRFTPSGGQIVVSTAYETNGSVVLRIRDTGIGMSRAELELAMKPFRQVAGAARNRGDGTGLGLPLTKAMVDANRANFAISSAPNEGTLVEVIFPSQRVLAS